MKNKRKNLINNKEKGLSLVGVLIAITIISLSLMAGLEFMSNALRASSVAKHEVIANFLAEEGVELTKNIFYRSNLEDGDASGYDYLDSLAGDPNPEYFVINYEDTLDPGDLQTPNAAGGALLDQDFNNAGLCKNNDEFFEGCATNSDADFYRIILLQKGQPGSSDCEGGIKITSYIYWSEKWDQTSIINGKDDIKELNPGGGVAHYSRDISACIFNW